MGPQPLQTRHVALRVRTTFANVAQPAGDSVRSSSTMIFGELPAGTSAKIFRESSPTSDASSPCCTTVGCPHPRSTTPRPPSSRGRARRDPAHSAHHLLNAPNVDDTAPAAITLSTPGRRWHWATDGLIPRRRIDLRVGVEVVDTSG